jgi:CubicO group peptidase (beta-lactamase class C family)
MILQSKKSATMSYINQIYCRKCSLIGVLLLVLQITNAQKQNPKIDDWLQSNLKELGGRAVLVIYKDGNVIYNHAENNLSGKQKFISKRIAKKQGKSTDDVLQDFDSNSKERIASCSKWLSAALVMTFVDEGKLSLEDSIGKYLSVMTANGKGQITIWQCLSHLTGIKTGSLKEGLQEITQAKSMDEAVTTIAALPTEGESGKTFHYSNAGLQIAAAVIEKISGQTFKTLFEERIAQPCNMLNTDFGEKKVPLAAGGAFSTAADYLNFLTMILNKGKFNGKQVLSEKSVAAMQVNRVPKNCTIAYTPAEAGNWGYGFGEWIGDGSTGNTKSQFVTSPGLFGSFPWVNNEAHYAAILFTFNINSKGRHERYIELKQLVDAAIQ